MQPFCAQVPLKLVFGQRKNIPSPSILPAIERIWAHWLVVWFLNVRIHHVLQRASAVARTMPNRVADKFRQEKAKLPQSTEAERLVVQRVGQGLFRDALLDCWQGRCCVSGLALPSLLRASHIKPWGKCVTDDERLDVFNGLLLAPHLDALFDRGWISFEDGGALLTSASLPEAARLQLGLSGDWRLDGLKQEHTCYLAFHRQHEFRTEKTASSLSDW